MTVNELLYWLKDVPRDWRVKVGRREPPSLLEPPTGPEYVEELATGVAMSTTDQSVVLLVEEE